jgi:hypothetical protein
MPIVIQPTKNQLFIKNMNPKQQFFRLFDTTKTI